jgi:hypothetical protein
VDNRVVEALETVHRKQVLIDDAVGGRRGDAEKAEFSAFRDRIVVETKGGVQGDGVVTTDGRSELGGGKVGGSGKLGKVHLERVVQRDMAAAS